MRRRELILGVGGTFALPSAARARQQALPVIGFLSSASPDAFAPFVAAFKQSLGEAGYVEGRNLAIEYRWAEDRYDRLPSLAADLARRDVALILSGGGTVAALAAKRATTTTPIVFVNGGDPVANGLVASLSRPNGNVTGVTFLAIELMSKRLDILSHLLPEIGSIALLVNPSSPNTARIIADTQRAAQAQRVQLRILKARLETEIDAAFAALAQLHVQALLIGGDVFFTNRRGQLVTSAAHHAVPTMYDLREFVALGGLISYGPSIRAAYRQAGKYAGRILEGVAPTDLPVQRPKTFELVINLKTAKAPGLTVPPLLLAQADEVIE